MMDGSAGSLSSSPAPRHTQSSLNPQSSLNSALTDAAEVYNADSQADSKGLENTHAARDGEIPNGLENNQMSSLGYTDLEPRNAEESHGQGSKSKFPDGEEIEDEGACSAKFELTELELIEDALEKLRMKSGTGPQLAHDGDAVGKASGNSETAKDLEDVGRLLKKVQAVRTQKKEARSRGNRSMSTGGEELDSTNIRRAVQTASEVAFAAAEAVEKIARVVNKNSAAIERLSKTLETSGSQEPNRDTLVDVEEIEDRTSRVIDTPVDEKMMKEQTEITKDVINQNRITHWVLGFMVATTCLWRFFVFKSGKKVQHTLNNPFDSFTGMFPKDEVGGFKFPFQNAEEETKKEKNTRSVKEGDNGGFNIANMWPNGEQDKKKR